MNLYEATIKRIEELRKQQRLSAYALIYQSGMPPSTFKSIMRGQSKNPGISSIHKIADGLGVSIHEFFDSQLFDELDQDD